VNLAAKENTYLVAAKNLNTLRGHLLDCSTPNTRQRASMFHRRSPASPHELPVAGAWCQPN
jgi:hypothetical protein